VEPLARVYDVLESSIDGERRRKIRTLSGNFQSFVRNGWLFNPVRNPGVIQFVSHKVLRLAMPYCLLTTLLTAAFIDGPLYTFAFAAQLAFYVLALIGRSSEHFRKKSAIFSFPTTFVELNASAVLAFVQFASRQTDVKWDKL